MGVSGSTRLRVPLQDDEIRYMGAVDTVQWVLCVLIEDNISIDGVLSVFYLFMSIAIVLYLSI